MRGHYRFDVQVSAMHLEGFNSFLTLTLILILILTLTLILNLTFNGRFPTSFQDQAQAAGDGGAARGRRAGRLERRVEFQGPGGFMSPNPNSNFNPKP